MTQIEDTSFIFPAFWWDFYSFCEYSPAAARLPNFNNIVYFCSRKRIVSMRQTHECFQTFWIQICSFACHYHLHTWKSLSTTASDCGTNRYNSNSFLIFGKAASITESPSTSLTVSGDCFFSWITCSSLTIFFIVCCDLYFLASVNASRDLMFFFQSRNFIYQL